MMKKLTIDAKVIENLGDDMHVSRPSPRKQEEEAARRHEE